MNHAANESAQTFECEGETLVGILHHPAGGAQASRASTAVLVIVGGPQYRVGSHRQFVLLARSLAQAGHPVLRFDVRGMGDSTGPLHEFEHIDADIGAAIDLLLQRAPEVRRVVLWGLCDGASAILLYLQQRDDPRVAALCLLNPWARSDASLARTHVKHYYLRRLREKEFWLKLVRGGIAGTALRGLFGNIRRAVHAPGESGAGPFQSRMREGLRRFRGRVLLLLSGDDYTAKEFLEYTATDRQWQALLGADRVERHDLPGADHTLSEPQHLAVVNEITARWLGGIS